MADLQRYNFAMAAGGVVLIPCTGTRFLILSSVGAVDVRMDVGGSMRNIEAGQGYRGRAFTGLEISDASGAANSGYILVSDDDFVDNRITGEVSIINGEKLRTLAGGRYSSAPTATAVAAQHSVVQLHNPTADRNLIVTAVGFAANGATQVIVYPHNVALTTDYGSVNYLLGTAGGQGHGRSDNIAAEHVYNWGQNSVRAAAADDWNTLALSGPIVVTPGYALNIVLRTQNLTLLATFEWFEEAA